MSVADPVVFEREHILAHKFNVSPMLAEQAVHCLELVAELSSVGLSYQFKGGNSLLLILDTPRRFSIDVDVATDEPREHIEHCLDRIVAEFSVFRRWERRAHKTKPWLPLASYYLYFDSRFTEPAETCIMFDVQLRRSPYRTAMKQVTCGELYTAPVAVELPLPSGIIGDKLLTLGPNTLGIPLGKGKEAQRLKHVFDVSVLAGEDPDLEDMRASFLGCLAQENEIQKSTRHAEEILFDTLEYCAGVARLTAIPAVDAVEGSLRENVVGLPLFADHLFAKRYSWEQAQMDMARAAVAITAVCRPEVTSEAFAAALRGEVDTSDAAPLPTTTKADPPCAPKILRHWSWVASLVGWSPWAGAGNG